MRSTFPLFNTHLDLAHKTWKSVVTSEDLVIDMTVGNGHDTYFLASLCPKKLVALDIQPQALQKAQALCPPTVEFLLKDHAVYPDELEASSVKLVVYNLGWLPGSDKSCLTLAPTTLTSLQKVLPKIVPGGVVSITCYPGHPEGELEEKLLNDTLKNLDPLLWSVVHHRFLNRKAAPSLFLLQKAL